MNILLLFLFMVIKRTMLKTCWKSKNQQGGMFLHAYEGLEGREIFTDSISDLLSETFLFAIQFTSINSFFFQYKTSHKVIVGAANSRLLNISFLE